MSGRLTLAWHSEFVLMMREVVSLVPYKSVHKMYVVQLVLVSRPGLARFGDDVSSFSIQNLHYQY
jgi:hypothetical protein